MHVIGTAGHVDHGKSALVAALTGTHPDRLTEEINREMTIDLGFAWLQLPDQSQVGIIDVPGHRDFIENMLAGVGGIDAVLFVVAADEGVMPQTREHLAILDLLQIDTGIIVLNKIDIIDDPDWLDLVELDLRDVMKGTVLENAPLVRVSSKTMQGIQVLRDAIQNMVNAKSPRLDLGHPRMSIDRIFSLQGFGTIVTGTLLDGCFTIGDEIEILPHRLKGRIRGLQTHKQKEEKAFPGSRTAINISGVNKQDIKRGEVVAHPGDYLTSDLVDIHFRLLKDSSRSLKHNTEVKLFIGASEVLAQCRVLGIDELHPGKEGFLQLRLEEPIVAMRGDRYIIRRPSPSETLGGGVILDPHPKNLHKRFQTSTLISLERFLKGNPKDIIIQLLERIQISSISEIINKTGLEPIEGNLIIQDMIKDGSLIQLVPDSGQSQTRIMSQHTWQRETQNILDTLNSFHKSNPLYAGMTKEALRAKTGQIINVFEMLLSSLNKEGKIKSSGTILFLSSHQITFNQAQEKLIEEFFDKFDKSPYSPPSYKDGVEFLGRDLLQALLEKKKIIKVSEDVIFSQKAYTIMSEFVMTMLDEKESITLAEVRDQFQTSRKYALALLEYLDTIGVTIRQGDLRIRKIRS